MAGQDREVSISVALCTYNGERYVREQLESIANQTRPPAEVVIADDRSTDGTLAVVSTFIAQYSGATVFRIAFTERAGGVRANFERAIEACTGDLIALSDQDDVWLPDRLEVEASAFAARADLLAVHADARIVDGNGRPTGATLLGSLYVGAVERESVHDGRGLDVLIRRNIATGATMMFRRQLLATALPLAPSWVHDEWLAVIAASLGGLDLIESPVIDYRVHGANAIGVAEPTLRNRLRQLRVPRASRYAVLAARSRELVERLGAINAPQEVQSLARRKLDFESVRSRYPSGRLRRLGHVLRNARRGGYGTLSSQGAVDIVRDLVQPA